MTRNPWKTLGTKSICENPWFRVRTDRVIRPDGNPGTYSVVTANRLALGILPLWADDTLTLVGQYRYPLREYSWEIPEGGGDPGEDPLVAAKRELLEETGIEADRWQCLGRCDISNCFLDERGHLYLARDLRQGRSCPGPDEEIETRRVPLQEAIEMANDGRITDALSIVGPFRLAHLLKIP